MRNHAVNGVACECPVAECEGNVQSARGIVLTVLAAVIENDLRIFTVCICWKADEICISATVARALNQYLLSHCCDDRSWSRRRF